MATQIARATNVAQTGKNWHNVDHCYDNNTDSSYAYRNAAGTSASHVNGFRFNIPSNAVVSKITVSIKWYTSNSRGYLVGYLRSINNSSYISIFGYANGQSHTTPSYGSIDISAAELQEYVNSNNIYNKNIIELINSGLHLRFVGGSTSSSRSSEVRIYDSYIKVYYEVPYTVSFNGNGATSGSVASLSKIVGEDFSLPANGFTKKYSVTLNPNYSGANNATAHSSATFNGWEDHGTITAYTGEVFSKDDFDAPFYSNAYNDLYKVYKYNKQGLVDHYVKNGRSEGRSCTGNPRGVYPAGATVNSLANEGGSTNLYAQWSAMSSITLPTPTRDSYTFLGWYTAASGGTKVADGGGSYTPTDNNIVLYAHWKLNEITDIYIGTSILDVYLGSSKVDVYQGTIKIYG